MSENSIKTDGNELNIKSEMNTKAMYRLSYGLFVCTVKDGKKTNGYRFGDMILNYTL